MKIKVFFSLVLLVLLSFFFSRSENGAVGMVNSALAQGVLESLEENITSLVESIKPSLVTIEAEIYAEKRKRISSLTSFVGSGVIYSSDGYILTTSSVVRGMQDFKIRLSNPKDPKSDKKEYKARLVGTDFQTNLAILKIDAKGLRRAKFGNSDKIKEGSWVTVVGNSYGLPTAVSFGVVNGIREDKTIQMSVNVSPGNSGGPVLNTKGEVIGLVSAKLSETSYLGALRLYEEEGKRIFAIPPTQIEIPSSGISLAIPINLVREKADWVIKHRKSIEKGYLGIYLEDLDEETKEELRVKGGILIVGVVQGSPADKAGLKYEDIVIEFNQDKVKDSEQFRELIGNSQPDKIVKLKIIREGKKKNLTAKLGRSGSIYSYWKEKTIIPAIRIPEINLPEIKIWYDEGAEKYEETLEKYLESMEKAKFVQDKDFEILKVELKKFKRELEKLSKELKRLSQKLKESKEER